MENKGFTLIELMIVVAIIGILAAVAIPAYQCKVNGSCDSVKSDTLCHTGFIHVRRTGRQLIDENGHGVPCNASVSANAGAVSR